ncbi:MAG: HAD family hydrolase [Calditrichaeota bacterium]|nr:HAD family hydrolase [Calditrichota bacterium]
MNKAVFLDRDGTIIEEMGYINHFSRIRIFPFAIEAIQLFNRSGFKVVIVTNQAGVAKGYFSEELLLEMNQWMKDQLRKKGAVIDGIYYCPHHPKEGSPKYKVDCNCRKPKTGLVEKAVKDLNINIKESFVIGDRPTDVELANRLQIPSIFVLTGYGLGDYVKTKGALPVKPKIIFNNILQAAQFIINYDNKWRKNR